MRVLVACEFSGVVREAFRKRGHDALSCDLLRAEDNSPYHLQFDVRYAMQEVWDMLIAFPPCTHLAASGARWFKDKQAEQAAALAFIQHLMDAPIARIAIENPIGVISTRIRKPDQIIQPWQFGHGETKATCLWLKGLPPPPTHQHSRGACSQSPPRIPRPGQVEAPEYHVPRNSRCNGGAVGIA